MNKGYDSKKSKNTVMFKDIGTIDTIHQDQNWLMGEDNEQNSSDSAEDPSQAERKKREELIEQLIRNYNNTPIDKADYTTIDSGNSTLRINWIRQRGSRDE